MRFALGLSVVLLGLLALTGTAGAKGHGHKAKKCKGGKVAVTINRRAKCTPLRKALPNPKEADQNLAAVQQALGMDLKGLERHGKKVPSARGVLGAGGLKKLEGAVSKGLTLAQHLKVAKRSTLSSLASPLATASGGCTPIPAARGQGDKFKSGGLSGSVDLSNGSVQLGIEGGPGGLRVQLDLRICDQGGLKLPSCPEANGRLDGTDESLMSMDLKVFQGSEQVFGQSFGFKSRTVIAPVQVDDNAKVEFFEIDHRYSENSSNNGVSVHFNYHGHARVTYPGANYDPTGTDVEARASVAGVDDSNDELREAEFDLAFDAKPKADKIFGEEVDKVIKALESAEKNWMTPNKCAQVTFTPETKSLKPLKKDKQDTFDAEVKSADGGKPDSGTWTVLKQANGTFTPTTAHSNPAKFNYTVKKVGNEVFIETKLKVVSAAGVAEKDWIQPTEPDLINHISGTFTVTTKLAGSVITWSGEATYDRGVPGLSGAMGVYFFASGSVTGVFSGASGDGNGCEWTGQHTFTMETNEAVTVLEVSPGSLEPPYEYGIFAAVRNQTPTGVTHTNCSESKYNGTAVEIQPDMDLETNSQVSDDGIHYKGSSHEEPGSGYTIDQTWDFEGVK